MKYLVIFLILFGCRKQEQVKEVKAKVKAIELKMEDRAASSLGDDDFSDLKKEEKDENCELEEDIEKKLVKKETEAFQLQGKTDEDCTVQ